ncbi:hypothetical protein C8J57DRAFT_1212487 [Mycena rebaudengoi]|nr:hypothetical protein C8J57DRAFT_1212487 [Mycena rebaudengoi]
MRFAAIVTVVALFVTFASASSIQAKCYLDYCTCDENGCVSSPDCCAVERELPLLNNSDSELRAKKGLPTGVKVTRSTHRVISECPDAVIVQAAGLASRENVFKHISQGRGLEPYASLERAECG